MASFPSIRPSGHNAWEGNFVAGAGASSPARSLSAAITRWHPHGHWEGHHASASIETSVEEKGRQQLPEQHSTASISHSGRPWRLECRCARTLSSHAAEAHAQVPGFSQKRWGPTGLGRFSIAVFLCGCQGGCESEAKGEEAGQVQFLLFLLLPPPLQPSRPRSLLCGRSVVSSCLRSRQHKRSRRRMRTFVAWQTAWRRRMMSCVANFSKSDLLSFASWLTPFPGKTCPRCGQGSLSKVSATWSEGLPKLRCRAKCCHVYINPHHLHPLFVDGRGAGTTTLQTQAALLFLKLNNVSHAVIHRLLNINHKVIEDMEKRLCYLRKEWVDAKEKLIDFGAGRPWADVEADETTFDRKHMGQLASDPTTPIAWEQWCGIVKRGNPKTLVLCRLTPKEIWTTCPWPTRNSQGGVGSPCGQMVEG